ncbi:MAG TPA: outer membrane beta-barrel protein [Candidatus Sulfotelmatobacter sp.]|jgi:opacity protein-like surface antigen
MSGQRLWIAAVLAATLLSASAVAQDETNEIGGILGRTFISNKGVTGGPDPNSVISSGNGLTFNIEYARRLIVTPVFAISGEAMVMVNKDEDINGGAYGFAIVPNQYSELFVVPAARANLFPTTAVSPWVSIGVGFGRISESKNLIYGGPNPGGSSTSAVIQGGLGLDVKVWKKLFIRGEVRDFWSGEPDFPLAPTSNSRQHNYFVGGGAFWRF